MQMRRAGTVALTVARTPAPVIVAVPAIPTAGVVAAPDPMSIKILPLSLLALAAVLSGMAWWFYVPATTRSGTTPYQALMVDNASFAEADALYKSGEFAEARQKYQDALENSADSVQEGQIKIKAAHTLHREGKKIEALIAYKEVADNTNYPSITRAYAIQNIATIFNLDGDPVILEETFRTEPYKSMRVVGDNGTSYKNLYEYASSLYPLAFTELRSASWYAARLMKVRDKTLTLTDYEVAQYKQTIQEKFANADKDIVRVQKDENERSAMPELLKRRANLLGQMAYIGEVESSEADKAYVDAMNLAALSGIPGEDGFTRYFYAAYLARYGAVRKSEVISVLEPYYKTTAYTSGDIAAFFKAERANRLSQKKDLQKLAGIDPLFKAYLSKFMGWAESDFVAK